MISDKELIRIISEEEEGTTLDYKEELKISTVEEKANFVKDIVSLANSGETSHIIVGVEDGTRKPLGMNSSYKLETLNQILKDKIDPPLRIDYRERISLGCLIGVVEIDGSNPPYIISVPDRYGCICRGTVYVRNINMNEGAVRADIDRIYNRMKPIILESDVHLSCEVLVKPAEGVEELVEVESLFICNNAGDAIAVDTYMVLNFANVEKIIKCGEGWSDVSNMNEGKPVVQLLLKYPVIKGIQCRAQGVVVQVKKDIKNIRASIIIGASNMRTRAGKCSIPVVEGATGAIF